MDNIEHIVLAFAPPAYKKTHSIFLQYNLHFYKSHIIAQQLIIVTWKDDAVLSECMQKPNYIVKKF